MSLKNKIIPLSLAAVFGIGLIGKSTYDKGFRDGRAGANFQAYLDQTNREIFRQLEIEAYLRLPQNIRDCDKNKDARFGKEEVEQIYQSGLLLRGSLGNPDQRGYIHPETIELCFDEYNSKKK